MKLDTYLKKHRLTSEGFAQACGGLSGQTVHNYRHGIRFPSAGNLLRIRQVTKGAVVADDFVEQHTAPSPAPVISEQQVSQRDFIGSMLATTGLDATALALAAGLAPLTLTRFLNQRGAHVMRSRTLDKLSRVSGVNLTAVIGPAASRERELLEAYRSSDKQGRMMLLRLARSLKGEAPGKPEAAE
jgi:hypothetical protein